jgi:hypothetical protein
MAAEDTGDLPLAIALIGGALLAGYMAYRPWPVASGKPVKPGAYAFEILEGQVPAAGPPAVSAAEVQATEYALDMVLGIWAVTKLSKVLLNVAQTLYDAAMAGLAGFQGLLGAGGGASTADETGTSGEDETGTSDESDPGIGGGGETVGELEQAAADAGLP